MPNPRQSCDKLCVIPISNGWRLTSDALQWIVERKHGHKWRKLHFIATKKAVLNRIIREERIQLTPEASRAVDALPAYFSGRQIRAPKILKSDPREKGRKRLHPLPSPNSTLSVEGERVKQNESNAFTTSHQARVPALFT